MSKPSSSKTKAAVSASDRRAREALQRAAERREMREKQTVYAYSPRFSNGLFGLPFFAKTDEIAILAMREFRDKNPNEPFLVGMELVRLGSYCFIDGLIKPLKPVTLNY